MRRALAPGGGACDVLVVAAAAGANQAAFLQVALQQRCARREMAVRVLECGKAGGGKAGEAGASASCEAGAGAAYTLAANGNKSSRRVSGASAAYAFAVNRNKSSLTLARLAAAFRTLASGAAVPAAARRGAAAAVKAGAGASFEAGAWADAVAAAEAAVSGASRVLVVLTERFFEEPAVAAAARAALRLKRPLALVHEQDYRHGGLERFEYLVGGREQVLDGDGRVRIAAVPATPAELLPLYDGAVAAVFERRVEKRELLLDKLCDALGAVRADALGGRLPPPQLPLGFNMAPVKGAIDEVVRMLVGGVEEGGDGAIVAGGSEGTAAGAAATPGAAAVLRGAAAAGAMATLGDAAGAKPAASATAAHNALVTPGAAAAHAAAPGAASTVTAAAPGKAAAPGAAGAAVVPGAADVPGAAAVAPLLPRCRVVATGGLGGSGKTTLAAAVVREQPSVRAAFDDIYWITLGRASREQLLSKMLVLINELEDGNDCFGVSDSFRQQGRRPLPVFDDEVEFVNGRPLKPGWTQVEDDDGDVWYAGPGGASSWLPPYADAAAAVEEDRAFVDGRRLREGWRRIGPDAEGDVWYEDAAGNSSWVPPFADKEGEIADGETDGARLAPGWRRCKDLTGDVWYENDATGKLQWTAPLLAIADEAGVAIVVDTSAAVDGSRAAGEGGHNFRESGRAAGKSGLAAGEGACASAISGRAAAAAAAAAQSGADTLAAASEALTAGAVTRYRNIQLRKELRRDAEQLRALLLLSSSKGKRRENSTGPRQRATTAPLALDCAKPDAVRCNLRGPEAAAVRSALWDFLGPVQAAAPGPLSSGRPAEARQRSAAVLAAAATRAIAALDREEDAERLKACAARVLMRLVRFQNHFHYDVQRVTQRALRRQRSLATIVGAGNVAAGAGSSGAGAILEVPGAGAGDEDFYHGGGAAHAAGEVSRAAGEGGRAINEGGHASWESSRTSGESSRAAGSRRYTIEAATKRLRSLLSSRRALVVVDDAWTLDHFAAFLGALEAPGETAAGDSAIAALPGPTALGSSLLFTTRNLDTFRRAAEPAEARLRAAEAWARRNHCAAIETAELPREAARAFLAAAAGIEPEHAARLKLAPVFDTVGTLPLALAVVGACVRKQLEPLRRPDRTAEEEVVSRLAEQLTRSCSDAAGEVEVAADDAVLARGIALEWAWRAGAWAWRVPVAATAAPAPAAVAANTPAATEEPPPAHGTWLESARFVIALREQNRDASKTSAANAAAFTEYLPAFRAVALTLATLFGESDALSFAALGLFAEDTAVHEVVVAAAWRMEPAPARALLERLQAAGLVKLEAAEPEGGEGSAMAVMLHDLSHNFAAALCSVQAGGSAAWHANLLARLAGAEGAAAEAAGEPCRPWWLLRGAKAGFVAEHLLSHLRAAGSSAEAAALAFRLPWLQFALRRRGTLALVADLERNLVPIEEVKLLVEMLKLSRIALEIGDNDEAADSLLPGQVVGRIGVNLDAKWPATLGALRRECWDWKGPRNWIRPVRNYFVAPGGPLKATLEGHTVSVSCSVTLPDGHIVSGSMDNTLRVWDGATGVCERVLEGHTSRVSCLAVSGGRVVSGSDDKSLRVWDAVTGACERVLAGHTKTVNCLAVLPDGRVVSGSDDKSLRVWDAVTGACESMLAGHTEGVRCLAVLPDGRRIMSGSDDKSLRIWDAATGACERVLEGHTERVICLAVLPDGRVVSGSRDFKLRVWDAATGACERVLEGHTKGLSCLAVLPDGRVVSGSGDESLRVWDAATSDCDSLLERHTSEVSCLAVLPYNRVVSGSWDKCLRVWDAATGKCERVLKGHTSYVLCLAVLPGGRIVSGSWDKSLRVWDAATGKC
jgi:WD40 repeat protein